MDSLNVVKTKPGKEPGPGSRLPIAAVASGVFLAVGLGYWEQHFWLAVYLFGLGALGPVSYVVCEAAIAKKRKV